jgi:triosephosphate isomerase (TIM)
MKHLFIAGNWKSNKTIAESDMWRSHFVARMQSEQIQEATVVVCAPYIALGAISSHKSELPEGVVLGAQDVSGYAEGAYTGEVTAKMICEVAQWVIIGHSERRNYFGETDEVLAKKVEQAMSVGLKTIYCVQDEQTKVPKGVDVVAYEPVWAIGTGKTDTPENAANVVANIKKNTGVSVVIYGGSITADNVALFVSQSAIDGVLPGGASLDPEKFALLLSNAMKSRV